MIHNTVTDEDGGEHQAVKGDDCDDCSLDHIGCFDIDAECMPRNRSDREDVIYKRRIKIGDFPRRN